MSNSILVAAVKKGFTVHEDWAVVIVGFLIILMMLSGVVIPVPVFSWASFSELNNTVLSGDNLLYIFLQFVVVYVFGLVGAVITNRPVKGTAIVFPIVFILTLVALIVAGNEQVKALNLEAVIFSLAFGLTVGNFVNLPKWFREALSTELYVKIGLVLLGTSIIFSDILKAGSLGLVQSLFVVVSVWYFAYWLCKKLRVDDELAMMISSAVSICGVSAAIATAGAIKGDSKKLSYVISLVLITAIPMMILMPAIANYFNFPQAVTGAWLGGSIDTTGAVVASGTLVGDEALKISTIVKFSQNVLLGLAAFAISIYWAYSGRGQTVGEKETPTLRLIWDRFPKFVLGFLGASLFFSFVLTPQAVDGVKSSLKSIQTLWFVLAFTSIGLETRFNDLFNLSNRKPMIAFVVAQGFNILVTLLIAYALFH
jgi:uncharacterized integral membrane protein (TIGR00698 family)